MDRSIHYGDQFYIEITNLDKDQNEHVRVFSSNSFIEGSVYAVKSSNYYFSNFKSCIFTIEPAIMVNDEETDAMNNIKLEIENLKGDQTSISETFVNKFLKPKEDQIKNIYYTTEILNSKLKEELIGKPVHYGDEFLLRHVESGYYLQGLHFYYPQSTKLSYLKLRDKVESTSYFKFYSCEFPENRGPVEFQSDVKLISSKINASVEIPAQEESDLTVKFKIEKEKETYIDGDEHLPLHKVIRKDNMTSFDEGMGILGLTFDPKSQVKIKIFEYCTYKQLEEINKKKLIKNGDYLRFNVEMYYLTGICTKDENLFCFQTVIGDKFEYNLCDTIFQIIEIVKIYKYPRATPITWDKKFILKCFTSGSLLTVQNGELKHSFDAKNLQYFQFIRNSDDDAHELYLGSKFGIRSTTPREKPEMRGSIMTLETMDGNDKLYLHDIEFGPNETNRLEINSETKYFSESVYNNEMIKGETRMFEKKLILKRKPRTLFKVFVVPDNEMLKILTIQSHVLSQMNGEKILRAGFRDNQLVHEKEIFETLDSKNKKLRDLIPKFDDSTAQRIAKESGLVDILCKIYYNIMISGTEKFIKKGFFNQKHFSKYLNYFLEIKKTFLSMSKNNDMNKIYIAQFLKIFISSLLNPPKCIVEKESIKLLLAINSEIIIAFSSPDCQISLKLIYEFKEELLEQVVKNDDYKIYYVQVLNHFLKEPTFGFDNQLKDLLDAYLLEKPEQIEAIFPDFVVEHNKIMLSFNHQKNDFGEPMVYDNFYSPEFKDNEPEKYFLAVVDLANTLAFYRSLLKNKLILKKFPLKIINDYFFSDRFSRDVREAVINMVKNVVQIFTLPYLGLSDDGFFELPEDIHFNQGTDEVMKVYQDSIKKTIENIKFPSCPSLNYDSVEIPRFVRHVFTSKKNSSKISRKNSFHTLITLNNIDQEILNKDFVPSKPSLLLAKIQNLKNVNTPEDKAIVQEIYEETSRMIILESSRFNQIKKESFVSSSNNTDEFNPELIMKILVELQKKKISLALSDYRATAPEFTQKLMNIEQEEQIVHANILREITEKWKDFEPLSKIKIDNGSKKSDLFKLVDALLNMLQYQKTSKSKLYFEYNKLLGQFETTLYNRIKFSYIVDSYNKDTFLRIFHKILDLFNESNKWKTAAQVGKEKLKEEDFDSLTGKLEDFICELYDSAKHFDDENEESCNQELISKIRLAKLVSPQEIHFCYDYSFIRRNIQNLLRGIGFVRILHSIMFSLGNITEKVIESKTKSNVHLDYIYRLVMINFTLFCSHNSENQSNLAQQLFLMSHLENPKYLKRSRETIRVVGEIFRDNKKLQRFQEGFLMNFSDAVFFPYWKKNNQIQNWDKDEDNSVFFLTLPIILDGILPSIVIQPPNLIKSLFHQFSEQIFDDSKFDMKKLIEASTKNPSIFLKDEKVIDRPTMLSAFKQYMMASANYAKNPHNREHLNFIRSEISLTVIFNFLLAKNLLYHYDIKRTVLDLLEAFYFDTTSVMNSFHTDTAEFTDYIIYFILEIRNYIGLRLDSENEQLTSIDKSIKDEETFKWRSTTLEKVRKIFDNFSDDIFSEDKSFFIREHILTYPFEKIHQKFIIKIIEFATVHIFSKLKSEKLLKTWNLLLEQIDLLESEYEEKTVIRRAKLKLKNNPKFPSNDKKKEFLRKKTALNRSTRSNEQHGLSIKFSQAFSVMNRVPIDIQKLKIQKEFKNKHLITKESLFFQSKQVHEQILKEFIIILDSSDFQKREKHLVIKNFLKDFELEYASVKNYDSSIDFDDFKTWKSLNENEEKVFERIQNTYVDNNIISIIIKLINFYKKSDSIIRDLLKLSCYLLFGGNSKAQNIFLDHFLQDPENETMRFLFQVLEKTLNNVFGDSHTRIFSAFNKMAAHSKYISIGKFFKSTELDLLDSNINSYAGVDTNPDLEKTLKDILEPSEKDESYEYKMISESQANLAWFSMKFFQLLCENHNLNSQKYLFDQKAFGIKKSICLPAYLIESFHKYTEIIHKSNLTVGSQLLSLIIEIQQGDSFEISELLLSDKLVRDLYILLYKCDNKLDRYVRGLSLNKIDEEYSNLKNNAQVLLMGSLQKSTSEILSKLDANLDYKSYVNVLKENIDELYESKNAKKYKDLVITEDDLFDNQLVKSACNMVIILRQISDVRGLLYSEFTKKIQREFDEFRRADDKYKTFYDKFLVPNIASVEIFKPSLQRIIRVYFPICPTVSKISDYTKSKFMENLDRSSNSSKLENFVNQMPNLLLDAEIDMNSNITAIHDALRLFTNILAIYFSVYMILFETMDTEGDTFKSNFNKFLGILQILLALGIFIFGVVRRTPNLLFSKWNEYIQAEVKTSGEIPFISNDKFIEARIESENNKLYIWARSTASEQKKELNSFVAQFYSFYFIAEYALFQWQFIYIIICILALFSPIFLALEIMDIVNRSDTVYRIFQAFATNKNQFLWTCILMIFTIQIYSVIGMAYLRDRYVGPDNNSYCEDVFSCFFFTLSSILRNGVGNVINPAEYNSADRSTYFWTIIYDFSFFVIIIVVLLNMIFGMIIETFSQLREMKKNMIDDNENVCLICDARRGEYEKHGNFSSHFQQEHNIWSYVAYIYYVRKKNEKYPDDLTDIESYVLEKYNSKELDFFPMGRSLTIDRSVAHLNMGKKSETELLRDDIKNLINLMHESDGNKIKNIQFVDEIFDS